MDEPVLYEWIVLLTGDHHIKRTAHRCRVEENEFRLFMDGQPDSEPVLAIVLDHYVGYSREVWKPPADGEEHPHQH